MSVQQATGPTGIDVGGPLRPFAASKTFANATGGIAISPPARALRVAGAGTLVLTYASGATDTITAAANETLDVEVVAIDTSSGATGITVYW